jgi:membrane-associated phospholipid phosphatase
VNTAKLPLLAFLLACYLAEGSSALAQTSSPDVPAEPLTARENALYSSEPEPLKPLGKKILRNVLLDQKEIWTSPFHMTRGDAKWWLLFGGITGGLIATDHWTSRQLPNTQDQLRVSGRVSNLGAVYTVVPVTASFYLVGLFTDNAKARETGLLGAQALVDGAILFEALKLTTERERPLVGDGHGHFFHGGDSFPSGHTMESFALASVIAHEYRSKKAAMLAYGLAGLVSASRFSGRNHFASDIVAPAAMGWFVGAYVFNTHQNASRQQRFPIKAILSPEVRPDVQPGAHSYGVSLAWHP